MTDFDITQAALELYGIPADWRSSEEYELVLRRAFMAGVASGRADLKVEAEEAITAVLRAMERKGKHAEAQGAAYCMDVVKMLKEVG